MCVGVCALNQVRRGMRGEGLAPPGEREREREREREFMESVSSLWDVEIPTSRQEHPQLLAQKLPVFHLCNVGASLSFSFSLFPHPGPEDTHLTVEAIFPALCVAGTSQNRGHFSHSRLPSKSLPQTI